MNPRQQSAAERLANDLRAVGYTVEGVEAFLGPLAAAALHREETVPALRVLRTRSGEPLAQVIRALLLGEDVPAEAIDAALPGSGIQALTELGIWRGGRAVVDLRPFEDGYVVSDFGEMVTGGPLPPNHVLGVGGATRTLASAIIAAPVRRALDMGTGCGALALQLARQADEVVATDLSPRALELARTTFALNGVPVDLRHGSLFGPVAGDRFDLIVSNPPFVITPREQGVPSYEYRDGGLVGDGLVRAVVAQVGGHLTPGGVAQLLGNWEVPRGQDWRDVVSAWCPPELDIWVMQRETLDPAQYAEMWLRDAGRSADHQALYETWLNDFESRDVEAIGFGLITARNPTGEVTLRRFEDVADAAHAITGDAVQLGLTTPPLTDDSTLVVSADVTQEHYYRPGEGDPTVVMLRQGSGLGRVTRVSSATAAVVGACDGTLPVGALIGAVAQLLDTPTTQIQAEVMPAMQELLFTGFLTTR